MSSDIKELINKAKSQIDLATARRLLKEKYQSQLVYAKFGGLFKITPEFILLCKTLAEEGYSEIVLPDINDNPIMIYDLFGFYKEILGRYIETLNDYHYQNKELFSINEIKDI